MRKTFLLATVLLLGTGNALCNKTVQTPVIELNQQKFYLTRVYSDGDMLINEYAPQTDSEMLLHFTQMPTDSAISFDKLFQAYDKMTNQDDENCLFRPQEDKTALTFATAQSYGYAYTRTVWDTDGFTKQVIFSGVPVTGNFAQTNQNWQPLLDKTQMPPLYTVRPGQKKQDDSEALGKIKKLLAQPYNPQLQKESEHTILADPTEKRLNNLIIRGPNEDVTVWLKENIGNYSPAYLAAFVQRLAERRAPSEDFVTWSMIADMRILADAELCTGATLYHLILLNRLVQMQTVFYTDKDLNAVDVKAALHKAIKWDKKHPQKNTPHWVCSRYVDIPNSIHPQKEWKKLRKKAKKEFKAAWSK